MMTSYLNILAERDAALQERNMAVDERKAALAARDMAIVQRDAALVERDSAIMERNNVIAALQYQDGIINHNNLVRYHQMVHHLPHLAEDAHDPQEVPGFGAPPASSVVSEKGKERVEDHSKQVRIASSNGWKDVWNSDTKKHGDLNRQAEVRKLEWKDYLGLDRVDFAADGHDLSIPLDHWAEQGAKRYKFIK